MHLPLALSAGCLSLFVSAPSAEPTLQAGIDFARLVAEAEAKAQALQANAAEAAAEAGADAAAKAAPEPNPRLDKLKALTFDRRPSVALKAWSSPWPPPEEADDDGDASEQAAAGQAPPATQGLNAGSLELLRALGYAGVPGAPSPGTTVPREATEPAEPTTAEEAPPATEAETDAAAAQAKALELELATFQRDVTLGDWEAVRTYLDGLTDEEAKAGYDQLVTSLVNGPPKPQSPFAPYAETNFFAPADVVGLAEAAPYELEKAKFAELSRILQQCVANGSLIEECIAELRASSSREEPGLPFGRVELARLLVGAGYPVEAGEFLPSPDEAIATNDRAALNLLSLHELALHAKEGKGPHLENAWHVLQAVLADGDVKDEDKEEALTRAVEIAPQVAEELGQDWLEQSFTERPERGMEILRVIGSAASNGLFAQAKALDARTKGLQLQTVAAQALLDAAPELANEWRDTLTLLASNWLREAEFTHANDTSTQRGPSMQRDPYGNFYYYNYRNRPNPNMPEAITTDDMLDMRPSDAWLALIPAGLRPKLDMLVAQLLLKVNEEDEAFPFIERVARLFPQRGEDLVEEFLRVWSTNHDPNAENNRTGRYMYFYGFEQRANAIPLTRSKQERNLEELAGWIARLRELPIENIDEELVANAFTTAHSVAEVYRIETIERVFGSLESLEPKTLAELIQKMRTNLVGVWRQPNTQKESKTNRRQKDIQAEVLRGYEVARRVAEQGLVDHPGDWSLLLARASVMHDENNYLQEVQKSSEFSQRRAVAFEEFEQAAAAYAATLEERTEDEESVKVWLTWFYASLGACDLEAIDHEKQPVQAQIEAIRATLEALPGEAAERHVGMFASTLFTRMSNVDPSVKFRYARAGLEVVGDHERAIEAREVYEYYSDLVTEIRLEARVDGPDRTGFEEPFGVFVDIRHTREIERESGGFSKYLTNQNNQMYSWNYGRPTENYRDKFEEAARETLEEQFEIHSITFNHPETNSRAEAEYGWRVTPYAYLLLQARGPEVDRIPSLHIDFDFLDTSGYAVLPIESSPVPIDAAPTRAAARPFADVRLTQTLDERQANEGKLKLEVAARSHGLVPDFDTLVELAPEGFDVVSVEDQGVSVAEFDEEVEEPVILSERIWMIEMRAKEDLTELPETFEFARAKVATAEVDYQRYVDADLESVEPVISLEARYGETSKAPMALFALFGALALGCGFVGVNAWKKRAVGPRDERRFALPDELTPFTVIGFLRDIEGKNGISKAQRADLLAHIRRVETYYFEENDAEQPDLESIAKTWHQRAT